MKRVDMQPVQLYLTPNHELMRIKLTGAESSLVFFFSTPRVSLRATRALYAHPRIFRTNKRICMRRFLRHREMALDSDALPGL